MRKYGLLLSSLIVLAIFFGGFYLFYVPANRAAQNKYGFLILQTIQSNLNARIKGNTSVYANNMQQVYSADHTGLKILRTRLQKSLGINLMAPEEPGYYSPDPTDTTGKVLFDHIQDDSIIYTCSKKGNTYSIKASLYDMLDGITKKFTHDFFQHFLLLHIKDTVMSTPVYRTDGLNLGDDIRTDSFLPASAKGFYPGIQDISLGDTRYKLFYSPLSLGDQGFVLCGFRDSGDYQQTLNQVPIKFIFPIAIILFLLLIILPLIKLYIMDKGESISIWDFAGFAFSLFIGAMFVTNVIIQYVLLKDYEMRTHNQLRTIAKQIDSNFQNELGQAYQELTALDELAYAIKSDSADKTKDLSQRLIAYITQKPGPDSAHYLNFDRVAWTNDSGMQIYKGQLDKQAPLYTQVSERKYFRDFHTNNPLRLSDSDTLLFTIEPVYSWVDGSFRFMIAKKSKTKNAFICQMSTIPYSVIRAILPAGFGFCIIDDQGEVQVHSDSLRNLNENLFDEVDDNRALKGAVAARQELYLTNLKFYTREHSVLLIPLKGLNYSLVVFYDNGHIVPVNMRILTFSLIFSLLFILGYILFLCILFFRRHPTRSLLFTGFDYLHWLLPKSRHVHIYQLALAFILVYLLGTLSFSFLTNTYLRDNNHALLILLFQTPVNIPLGVFIIINALDPKRKIKIPRLLILLGGFQLLYIIFSVKVFSDIPWSLILFDLLLILLLLFVNAYAEKIKSGIEVRGLNYFSWYTLLVEAIVISLAVLPASLFSYYAFNQEILQGIKKNQLSVAEAVESRELGVYGLLQSLEPAIPQRLIDTLRFDRGIYSPSKQTIRDTGLSRLPGEDPVYDRFYFQIADEVSNDYYQTDFMPALKDHSGNQARNWRISDDGKSLQFSYLMKADTSIKKAQYIWIDTPFSSRYSFFKGGLNFIILVLTKMILLVGLYFLIRQILLGVFLKRYLHFRSVDPPAHALPYFTDYLTHKSWEPQGDHDHAHMAGSVIIHFQGSTREAELDAAEHRIIDNLIRWKDYYEFVINQCNPREKRLLYNLARTGFINYKNSGEIYHLLEKEVLVAGESGIRLFSQGFRAYLLNEYSIEADPSMSKLQKRKSSWEAFKRPFLIILIGFAGLIFFTQQEAWQRISALLTALTTSIPVLLDMFRTGKNAK